MLYGSVEIAAQALRPGNRTHREANQLFEAGLRTESDRQAYERLLLNWAAAQDCFAYLAEVMPLERKDEKATMEGRKQAVEIRAAVVKRLQDELKATPDSVAVARHWRTRPATWATT